MQVPSGRRTEGGQGFPVRSQLRCYCESVGANGVHISAASLSSSLRSIALALAIGFFWPPCVALTPPVLPPSDAPCRPPQGVSRSHRLSEANWPGLLSHRVASDYRARNPGQDPRDYYTLAGKVCGLWVRFQFPSGRRALRSLYCSPEGGP